VRLPVYAVVFDFQHFAEPTGSLKRADDSISHGSAREGVFDAVRLVCGGKQPPLFVWRNPRSRFVSPLVLIVIPNLWKGEVVKMAGVRPRPQLIECRRVESTLLTVANALPSL
jgi:hypothetical protein